MLQRYNTTIYMYIISGAKTPTSALLTTADWGVRGLKIKKLFFVSLKLLKFTEDSIPTWVWRGKGVGDMENADQMMTIADEGETPPAPLQPLNVLT